MLLKQTTYSITIDRGATVFCLGVSILYKFLIVNTLKIGKEHTQKNRKRAK
jgi:hypothetical protein